MDVRNCRSCHRLFNYFSGPDICPTCKEDLEKKFEIARDYIRDNNGASIPDVAEAAGVSTQMVKQWVREERLQFAKDSPVGIDCETCGKTIRTGRYCPDCRKKMEATLMNLYKNEEPVKAKRDGNKMRFLD